MVCFTDWSPLHENKNSSRISSTVLIIISLRYSLSHCYFFSYLSLSHHKPFPCLLSLSQNNPKEKPQDRCSLHLRSVLFSGVSGQVFFCLTESVSEKRVWSWVVCYWSVQPYSCENKAKSDHLFFLSVRVCMVYFLGYTRMSFSKIFHDYCIITTAHIKKSL